MNRRFLIILALAFFTGVLLCWRFAGASAPKTSASSKWPPGIDPAWGYLLECVEPGTSTSVLRAFGPPAATDPGGTMWYVSHQKQVAASGEAPTWVRVRVKHEGIRDISVFALSYVFRDRATELSDRRKPAVTVTSGARLL